jgi:hypothetical protein
MKLSACYGWAAFTPEEFRALQLGIQAGEFDDV